MHFHDGTEQSSIQLTKAHAPHTDHKHNNKMRVAFFSTKDYDKASFTAANERLPEGERCVL